MPRTIKIQVHGGPEVLHLVDVPMTAPAAGEARVHQTAIGVNYIDVYHRTGLYPVKLPTG